MPLSTLNNNGWEYSKLKSTTKKELPGNELFNIIRLFKRREIFYHNFTANDLFRHIYKDVRKAKRQPNPFMLFRAVIGLVATEHNIKIGDGTRQSKLAGHMWGAATPNEKEGFKKLSEQFKENHKIEFPSYEYKPRPRCSNPGIHFDTKTPTDFQQPVDGINYVSHDGLTPQENFESIDQTYYYPIIDGFPSMNFPEPTSYPEPETVVQTDMIEGYPFPVNWPCIGETSKPGEITKDNSDIYVPSIAANLAIQNYNHDNLASQNFNTNNFGPQSVQTYDDINLALQNYNDLNYFYSLEPNSAFR